MSKDKKIVSENLDEEQEQTTDETSTKRPPHPETGTHVAHPPHTREEEHVNTTTFEKHTRTQARATKRRRRKKKASTKQRLKNTVGRKHERRNDVTNDANGQVATFEKQTGM